METHLAGQLFPGNRKPVETSPFKIYPRSLNDSVVDVESPFRPAYVSKIIFCFVRMNKVSTHSERN